MGKSSQECLPGPPESTLSIHLIGGLVRTTLQTPMRRLALGLLFGLLCVRLLPAAGVRVLFDPTSPETGPFPTDFLTTPDNQQRTGRRMNLPLPNCQTEASTCGEVSLVNQLDGFSLQPRLSVRFSGPVNPDTLRDGIKFVWLESLTPGEYNLGPEGKVTQINQVVYDPQTNTAYAQPDDFFDQSRRYAIVVTAAVRDLQGDPVASDGGFQGCLAGQIGGDYCFQLARDMQAVQAALGVGVSIRGGSAFTTMSATAFLQQARAQLPNTPLNVRRTGDPPVFSFSDLTTVVWRQQVRTSGDRFQDVSLPLSPALLSSLGFGRIAFGSYQSPSYLNQQQVFNSSPTAIAPTPADTREIFFDVILPAARPPAGGYPVVIAGHGITDSRFGMPLVAALALVPQGVAVIAINAVGHGYGPESTLQITTRSAGTVAVNAGGRGIDLDGDGTITDTEGCLVFAPGVPLGARDCLRQTAIDLMQLVRVLRSGLDVDGDGTVDLNGSRISYMSHSLGSFYGTMLLAVEPQISAAVFNVGGGSTIEAARWSPQFRRLLQFYMGTRQPPLLNAGLDYNESFPLRYQPVRVNNVAGAIPIQNFIARAAWIETPGAPYAYATHLRSATLPDVPIKRVLFQFALGDQTVPNPTNTQLIRAANVRDLSSLYRHDIARAAVPTLPVNPHGYLVNLFDGEAGTLIALATLDQASRFLLSDEYAVPDVNQAVLPVAGQPLFETPQFLPEDLNFQQP